MFRISLFGITTGPGAILVLSFMASVASAREKAAKGEGLYLNPDDMIVTIENEASGGRIDVVRIRAEFVFKSGETRTGYAVLYDLETGGKAEVDLSTATAKHSLNVVRVETTIDLKSGETVRRILRAEPDAGRKKVESKDGVSSEEGDDGDSASGVISAKDIPNLSDVYVSQISAFELKASGARRKRVAKRGFDPDDEHSGFRNKSYFLAENKGDDGRQYIIKPKGAPELVKRKDAKP